MTGSSAFTASLQAIPGPRPGSKKEERGVCGSRPHGWHGGCCCGGGMRRRFSSKEERLASLRDYLEELKAEAQQVEKAIRELEAEK